MARASGTSLAGLVKHLQDSLKDAGKRLAQSEDILATPATNLPPEAFAYHRETVAHYRTEVKELRASLLDILRTEQIDTVESTVAAVDAPVAAAAAGL